MRKKQNNLGLTKKEQVKKIEFRIKFLKIFSLIWSVFILSISIFLLTLTDAKELAISFLITWPVSILLGGYLPIKDYKMEIKNLKTKENKVE